MKLAIPCITLLLAFAARVAADGGAPMDLDERLARIEYARLHEYAGSPAKPQPSVVLAEPMSLTVNDPGVMWLTDVDPTIQDPNAPATPVTDETVHISTEKSDGYVRKSPLPSLWDTIKRDVKDAPC